MVLLEACASRVRQNLKLVLPFLGVVLLASPSEAQGTYGRIVDGVVEVRVENESDPLYFAIEKLSDLCRCPISYEEPEWTRTADIEVLRYPNGSRDVKIVKRGSLHVTAKGDDTNARDWVGPMVQSLIAQHHASGNSVVFQVAPGPPPVVLPQRGGNSSGVVEPQDLVLDTRLTFASETMPAMSWIARLARELGRASGHSVRILYPPRAPGLDLPVTLDAKDETARSVLRRLFADSPADIAWLVTHSPELDVFAVKLKFFLRQP